MVSDRKDVTSGRYSPLQPIVPLYGGVFEDQSFRQEKDNFGLLRFGGYPPDFAAFRGRHGFSIVGRILLE